ncbi:MAG TPA: DUF4301 family protein [Thermodesulfobacteriota bacterium]|nr:DUF4301 family protein [Thermodesulfobacteriota bacterium]
MNPHKLDPEIIREIEARGIEPGLVLSQIEMFERGMPPAELVRPCTPGDGIVTLWGETESYARLYESGKSGREIVKFVPASGAATRMFKDLLSASKGGPLVRARLESAAARGDEESGAVLRFISELGRFAFHDDLESALEKNGINLKHILAAGEYGEIIAHALDAKGLNYASLPKGMIVFHKYPVHNRTAFEEHLAEALAYATDDKGRARVHFTLSPEHVGIVGSYIDSVKRLYEKKGVSLAVAYSVQKPSTDTIAVDMENRPFLGGDGKPVFRPAGHGALIENLNALGCDIAFIKNVDNVVPDRLKEETYLWKKALGGYLLSLQGLIFGALDKLAEGGGYGDVSAELSRLSALGLDVPVNRGDEDAASRLVSVLDRPLRVCGVVKNQGEPGGGPFWVKGKDGGLTKQIVESAQVDMRDSGQKKIWESSTHFNPVDIVCGLKDREGKPYDLHRFIDRDAGFISVKSKDGRDLKALELPGLWNGAMAFWNTVFVEVPVITFNPVKTVFDLLKPEHQPKL